MPFFESLQDEFAAIDSRQYQTQMARSMASGTSLQDVVRANFIQRLFKWLPPGASYSLARGGLPMDQVDGIASNYLTSKASNTALGLNQPGDTVNSAVTSVAPNRDVAYQNAVDEWVQKHEHSKTLAAAADAAGTAASATGGFIANNPVSKALVTGDNPVASAVRGTTRGITTALDAPAQFLQGSYREVSSDIQDRGFAGLIHSPGLPKTAEDVAALRPGPLEQTDLGQALHGIASGNLDQGTGFFVGQDSGAAQARKAAELRYGSITYADGSLHARTIGRDFAGLFVAPGTKPYKILSGVADAGVRVASDLPSQHAVAIGHAATEFKSIDYGLHAAEDASTLSKVKDAIGIIANPGRRATYSREAFDFWSTQRNGLAVADKLAASDAYDIFKIAPKMPGELVGQLANESTPDGIRNILRGAVGQGADTLPTTSLGRFGVAMKTHVPEPVMEIANRLYGNVFDSLNPTERLVNADRKMDVYHLPEDTKRELFNQMAAIPHIPDDPYTTALVFKANAAIDHAGFNEVLKPYVKKIDGLPDGFDVLKGDINKGTYLSDLGVETPFTKEQRRGIVEARSQAEKIRDVFMPSKAGKVQDDIIYQMTGGGSNVSWQDAMINDNGTVVPGNSPDPWFLSEFHGRMIPNPDWGEVQNHLSRVAPLLNEKGHLIGTNWVHNIQEKIWKPLVIGRPAVAARTVGMAQAEMYANGMSNIGANPLNLIALAVGDGQLAERFGVQGALKTGPLGDVLADADGIKRVLNTESMYTTKKAATYLPDSQARFAQGENGYHDAVRFQISKMAYERNDPLAPMIADAMMNDRPLTEVQDQLWAMKDYREKMQAIAKHRDDGVQVMMDRRYTDKIVEWTAERIKETTGLNPELISEIAKPTLTPDELLAKIKSVDQTTLPDKVAGFRPLPPGVDAQRRSTADYMMGTLVGAPMNRFAEQPVLRQAVWKKAQALAPFLDPAESDKFVANAAEAGLRQSDLRQLKYMADKPVEGGGISLQTLDDISKDAGVEELKKMFMNHVNKRQFSKAVELIVPFAHHWSETLLRWSKFLTQDPTLLHNLEYGFHEATDPTPIESTGVGSVMGVPPGQGFLHPDPTTGDEMFTYPMSAQLMKIFTASGAARGGTVGAIGGGIAGGLMGGGTGALIGAATGAAAGVGASEAGIGGPLTADGPGISQPLVGSLKGTSLAWDVIPGIGPAFSAPLNALIPRTPEWDGVRNVVFPVGDPKSLLDLKGQMPSWMQRTFDLKDQRTMAATTADMVDSLGSSGKYDLHNPDLTVVDAETKRLMADARQSATWFTVFRGLAGAVSPSAPKPEWWFQDQTGKRILLDTLKNDFQTAYNADPQNAVMTFMKQYGDNVMLALQGKTVSVALGGGMPPTKGADQWSRSNGTLSKDLPLAYGFFAPRDDTKLDLSTYDRQITNKERAQLTPEQVLEESNKRVAQTVYYSVRNTLPANMTVEQSASMRKLRETLAARYPGYSDKFGNEITGVPSQAKVPETIAQLVKAATDTRLATNPATESLQAYLSVRDQINAQSTAALGHSDSWLTTNQGVRARALMYDVGSKLVAANPAFGPMWESVLYREFQAKFEADQGVTNG